MGAAVGLLFVMTAGCAPEPDQVRLGSLDAVLHAEARIDGTGQDLMPIAPRGSPNGAVAVGPEGIVAVRQQQTLEIRLFDETGRELRQLGGRGDGPGEFARITRLAWIGQELWASDSRSARVTYFPRVGTAEPRTRRYPSTIAAQRVGGDGGRVPRFPFVHVLGVMAEDTLVATLTLGTSQETADNFEGFRTVALISPDGEVYDLIDQIPVGQVQAALPGGGVAVLPFPEETHVQFSPHNRTVVSAVVESVGADSAVVTVDFVRIGADSRSVRFGMPSFEIPQSVREREESRFHERTGVRVSVPRHYPPLAGLVVDADGGAWVETRDPVENRRIYYAVAPDGSLLGRVAFPETAQVAAVKGEAAWVLEKDKFDVESLVRYRVTW